MNLTQKDIIFAELEKYIEKYDFLIKGINIQHGEKRYISYYNKKTARTEVLTALSNVQFIKLNTIYNAELGKIYAN